MPRESREQKTSYALALLLILYVANSRTRTFVRSIYTSKPPTTTAYRRRYISVGLGHHIRLSPSLSCSRFRVNKLHTRSWSRTTRWPQLLTLKSTCDDIVIGGCHGLCSPPPPPPPLARQSLLGFQIRRADEDDDGYSSTALCHAITASRGGVRSS